MKRQTAAWVEKAEGDDRVALREHASDQPVYDAVCFHAQQCVEKYLKAVCVEAGLTVERTHDLAYLHQATPELWPDLAPLGPALASLSVYAVAARYPGVNASPREASEAVATMAAARSVLRAVLGLAED
ncbi:MAG: HEPN domain-containing protein [Chloroflexi bacterium]|nr:HEPN domain-containing protein [Chloroflexota bacterium]